MTTIIDGTTGVSTTGNVTPSGLISSTGNVTSGNILTGGLISATSNITGGNVLTGGIMSSTGNVTGGNILTGGLISATGNLTLAIITPASSNVSIVGNVFPSANATYDLGSTSLRWRTIYTTDLELNNGIGDYTVVEGEDDLFLYNNRSGKVFKFALIEVDPAIAPPKAKR